MCDYDFILQLCEVKKMGWLQRSVIFFVSALMSAWLLAVYECFFFCRFRNRASHRKNARRGVEHLLLAENVFSVWKSKEEY